jgi:uracil-DNA glycosylase
MKVQMKAKVPMFGDLLNELREGKDITRLQGNLNASILLIAPQPSEMEVEENLCWVNHNAQKFFELMESLTELSPDDFLIMPTTFNGGKPVNANTELPKRFLHRAAHFKQIRRFVCIGSDAFKVFFGQGRKPSMPMLMGHTMYVTETSWKPLFVFPDADTLAMSGEHIPDKRQYSMMRRKVDQTVTVFEKLIDWKFKLFLKARVTIKDEEEE